MRRIGIAWTHLRRHAEAPLDLHEILQLPHGVDLLRGDVQQKLEFMADSNVSLKNRHTGVGVWMLGSVSLASRPSINARTLTAIMISPACWVKLGHARGHVEALSL